MNDRRLCRAFCSRRRAPCNEHDALGSPFLSVLVRAPPNPPANPRVSGGHENDPANPTSPPPGAAPGLAGAASPSFPACLRPPRPAPRSAGRRSRPSTASRTRATRTSPAASGSWAPTSSASRRGRCTPQAPFSRALDRRSSDAVAVKHYDWIKAELERRGLAATPYRIALAWNGGIRAVLDRHPPAAAADYATRAANIADEFEKSELADAR